MIELPNGTISRTLAEQVGFNSAKIAEIIKFLNESGLKDLVINLESDSGTLSTDQYAIAELSPSYMIYDGGVFYKVFEDSDHIDYFLLAEAVDTSNSDLDVSHWRIRVERDSRNYALETVNIFTSYTKSQIDSMLSTALALKANLSGANFAGPITAPSIIENMSGYSFELGTHANLTIEAVYAGIVKNGNKLTFVLAVNLTRTGTISGDAQLGFFTVPDEIWNKLYPADVGGRNLLDIKIIPAFSDDLTKVDQPSNIWKSSGKLRFRINQAPSNNLTLNTTYYYRYEATFLLSDNLAS